MTEKILRNKVISLKLRLMYILAICKLYRLIGNCDMQADLYAS